eukprot:Platyproteum_vivax@DN5613_c0_g1_i2.p1
MNYPLAYLLRKMGERFSLSPFVKHKSKPLTSALPTPLQLQTLSDKINRQKGLNKLRSKKIASRLQGLQELKMLRQFGPYQTTEKEIPEVYDVSFNGLKLQFRTGKKETGVSENKVFLSRRQEIGQQNVTVKEPQLEESSKNKEGKEASVGNKRNGAIATVAEKTPIVRKRRPHPYKLRTHGHRQNVRGAMQK